MPAKKQAVGLIGLGIIGSRVAANLRDSGFDVWVWSRSPRPEPNFLTNAREVAESAETILVFVSDGEALLETIQSMVPVLTAQHVVVNHATIGPDEARDAERVVRDAGASFLDAPFTGSRDAAAAGQIVYYVGGDHEVLNRVRPILGASAKEILEVGNVGDANLIKIATNHIAASSVQALAEAFALIERNGIPMETLSRAIESNACCSATASMKMPCMISGDFDPRFSLKNMFKDLRLVLEAAQKVDLDLPVAEATAGSLVAGMHKGWGDLDFSSIAAHYGYPGKELSAESTIGNAADGSSEAENPAPKKRFKIFG